MYVQWGQCTWCAPEVHGQVGLVRQEARPMGKRGLAGREDALGSPGRGRSEGYRAGDGDLRPARPREGLPSPAWRRPLDLHARGAQGQPRQPLPCQTGLQTHGVGGGGGVWGCVALPSNLCPSSAGLAPLAASDPAGHSRVSGSEDTPHPAQVGSGRWGRGL